MAQVYSAKAPHLSKIKTLRYSPGPISLLLLALMSAVFSWIFTRVIAADFSSLAQLILFLAVSAVMFSILKEFYIVYRRSNSHRFLFSSERARENLVLAELALLPDTFTVFHRVNLPGVGKMHIVVTSPTSVFCMRVRYVSGVVGFDGVEIIHNGGELEDEADLIYLTVKKAHVLSEFLTKRLGQEINVKPVVIFSPDTILTQLKYEEHNGAILVNPHYLDDYLVSGVLFSGSNMPVEKINQILLPLVMR